MSQICPLDGRYLASTNVLRNFFGEFAYMKYRLLVEIEYLIKLLPFIKSRKSFQNDAIANFRILYKDFDLAEFCKIKAIEQELNHDIKAVEYYIRNSLGKDNLEFENVSPFVHFALTSHDINSCANVLRTKDAFEQSIAPAMETILAQFKTCANRWKDVVILAKTHGQYASPTNLGKEMQVYVERLACVLEQLKNHQYKVKFGGAVGNFNAHYAAFPGMDWMDFANDFAESLGLKRSQYTTQVEHYDSFAEFFHKIVRFNTILVDACRDFWMYISANLITLKIVKTEIGSSTMPHKVNPIRFENAEGNLLLSNAICTFLAQQLPLSRLQRDLVNSTLFRNIGVALGYAFVAYQSLCKGMQRIDANREKIFQELEQNYQVVAEPIQTILKAECGDDQAYEKIKQFVRKNGNISQDNIKQFINDLDVDATIKQKMQNISPKTYVGQFPKF